MRRAAPCVTLPGGLTVPLAVLHLVFDFERRGIELGLTDEGEVAIAPHPGVTDADRARIRRWTPQIRALGEVRVLVQ